MSHPLPPLASVCVTACLSYHNIPDLSTPFLKVFQKNFPGPGRDLSPGRDPIADQEQQGFRSHRFPRNKNRRGRTRRSAPTVYDRKFPPAPGSESKHVREAKETVSASRTRVPRIHAQRAERSQKIPSSSAASHPAADGQTSPTPLYCPLTTNLFQLPRSTPSASGTPR